MTTRFIVNCINDEAAEALLVELGTKGWSGTRLSGIRLAGTPFLVMVFPPQSQGLLEDLNCRRYVLNAVPSIATIQVPVLTPDQIRARAIRDLDLEI